MNWPYPSFDVTARAKPPLLPSAQATIKMIDFRFKRASTLRTGEFVRFWNAGFLAHEVIGERVKNANAARQVTALLHAGKTRRQQSCARATPLSPG